MQLFSLKSQGRSDSERSLISRHGDHKGRKRMQDSKTRSSTFESSFEQSPTTTKSFHDIPLRKINFLGGRQKSDSLPYQSIEVSAVGKEEGSSNHTHGPRTTVTWNGSSSWWLVGDICGIIIALCFLGMYFVWKSSCADYAQDFHVYFRCALTRTQHLVVVLSISKAERNLAGPSKSFKPPRSVLPYGQSCSPAFLVAQSRPLRTGELNMV